MASLYHKGDDARIWLRYRDAAGKWRGKVTSYRWGNAGEVRQATLLAQKASEREAEMHHSPAGESSRLTDWVTVWLRAKYGDSQATTPAVYNRRWRVIMRYLAAAGIHSAGQIRREFIDDYLAWRLKTAGRNTAIADIKFMSMIMGEAVKRGHIAANPLAKPGLRKTPAKEKLVWSNEDIGKAAVHLEKHESHWMQTVFYMGLYQACRLRNCAVPLDRIRPDLGLIQYPGIIVKGGEAFSQPIDARFKPILKLLMERARKLGLKTLCEIPWDATIRLRRTFDRAGLPDHSHHGLRVTWITRACEAGVPEGQAMAFCHHASREVHRVYKKLSAIEIAHVPAAVSLPALSPPLCAAPDSPASIRDNAPASSAARIQTDTRG